jgi:hypothetical protein
MEDIIEFIRINKEWVESIWCSMGIVGLFIFYKYTRPSFYKDFTFQWIIIIPLYMYIGPFILCLSLLTLLNAEKKDNKK